jgi:hypothetical protein
LNRQDIRSLKRAVIDRADADAMHVLLARSVAFRHKKLAVLRCLQAEQMGVNVAPELLGYCQRVADGLAPSVLRAIVVRLR